MISYKYEYCNKCIVIHVHKLDLTVKCC